MVFEHICSISQRGIFGDRNGRQFGEKSFIYSNYNDKKSPQKNHYPILHLNLANFILTICKIYYFWYCLRFSVSRGKLCPSCSFARKLITGIMWQKVGNILGHLHSQKLFICTKFKALFLATFHWILKIIILDYEITIKQSLPHKTL